MAKKCDWQGSVRLPGWKSSAMVIVQASSKRNAINKTITALAQQGVLEVTAADVEVAPLGSRRNGLRGGRKGGSCGGGRDRVFRNYEF